MKTFLRSMLLLLLASPAFAQTACTGNNAYLGWGEGDGFGTNGCCHAWVNFSASFINASSGVDGTAICNGPYLSGDMDIYGQTCDPTTWNGFNADQTAYGPRYGTVTYDDGNGLAYSGQAAFWFDWVEAATPQCRDTKSAQNNGTFVTRYEMVRRLKVQSCTNGHVLTNRFIAVSCGGSYCETNTGNPCNGGGYAHENWLTMTISGF